MLRIEEVAQEVGVMPPLPVLMAEYEDEHHDKNEACITAMMLLNNPQ